MAMSIKALMMMKVWGESNSHCNVGKQAELKDYNLTLRCWRFMA